MVWDCNSTFPCCHDLNIENWIETYLWIIISLQLLCKMHSSIIYYIDKMLIDLSCLRFIFIPKMIQLSIYNDHCNCRNSYWIFKWLISLNINLWAILTSHCVFLCYIFWHWPCLGLSMLSNNYDNTYKTIKKYGLLFFLIFLRPTKW